MSNKQSNRSPKVSFHYSHYSLTSKKLQQTEDCKSMKSKFTDFPSVDISMFTQSNTSVKRINQIQPKSKLIIPTKIIEKSQDLQSQEGILSILSPTKKQSFQYSSIKPLFNWKRYRPLCGFQTKTGQNGCLCGTPCPLQQQWSKNYKETDTKLYHQLVNSKICQNDMIQIQKDIPRTHSQCLTFSQNFAFQQMLKQVLISYCAYDPQIGYVQGMNMIVGVILYHMKNSQLTFWAFVDLMDQQELRMIYLPKFQYLRIHQTRILNIMQNQLDDIVQLMDRLDVLPETFLNGWILSLMATCIPLQYMHKAIDNFRKNGWNYIYQLIITYLLFLKESLLRMDDQSEFLISLNTKNSRQYGVIWEELIQSAVKFPLSY